MCFGERNKSSKNKISQDLISFSPLRIWHSFDVLRMKKKKEKKNLNFLSFLCYAHRSKASIFISVLFFPRQDFSDFSGISFSVTPWSVGYSYWRGANVSLLWIVNMTRQELNKFQYMCKHVAFSSYVTQFTRMLSLNSIISLKHTAFQFWLFKKWHSIICL